MYNEHMKKEIDFYQVSLKLLLKNSKGEVLALKAADTGSIAGYWDFLGGRIDVDEFQIDFAKIIAREVFEEAGDIKFQLKEKPVALGRHLIPAHLSGLGKETHVLLIFFEADYLSGEVKISHEHLEYQWLDLNKIELEKYFTSGFLRGVRTYLGK